MKNYLRLFLCISFTACSIFYSGFAQSWTPEPLALETPNSMVVNSDGDIFCNIGNGPTLWKLSENSYRSIQSDIPSDKPVFSGEFTQISENGDTLLLRTVKKNMGNDLYFSPDGGNSWSEIPFQPNNIIDVFVSPDNHGQWFLGTLGNTYVTEDYGQTWEAFEHDYYSWTMVSMFDINGDLYGVFEYQGWDLRYEIISKWDENSSEWDIDNPVVDLYLDFNIEKGHFNKIEPLSNGEILVSFWMSLPFDQYYMQNYRVFVYDEYWNLSTRTGEEFFEWVIVEQLFEDKSLPGRVYAYAMDIYYSDDYGITWDVYEAPGLPEGRKTLSHVFQDPSTNDLYFSIQHEGLFCLKQGESYWEEIPIPAICGKYKINDVKDNLFALYGDIDGFIFNENFVQKITVSTGPDTIACIHDIIYHHADTLVAITSLKKRISESQVSDEYIAYSFDSGNSWSFQEPPGIFATAKAFSFHNGVHFLYQFNPFSGAFHISHGFEFDWECRLMPESRFLAGDTCFYGCVNYPEEGIDVYDIVYMPFDLDIWYRMHLDLDVFPTHIFSVNGWLLVKTYNNDLWWCLDNESWNQHGTFPPEWNLDSHDYAQNFVEFINYNNEPIVFFLDKDTGLIYSSIDQCETWFELDFETPGQIENQKILSLEYDSDSEKLWVLTVQGPMWTNIEPVLNNPEEPVQLQPVDPKLLSNYPNPFNASTKIQYFLTKPGNVKLDVYDITGRLVKTLENTYKPAGMQDIFLDGNGLASGTYFIRLNTGEEVRNHRITLVK